LWSDGQTTATATGLAAAAYTVTVTDANGCTGTLNVTVNNAGAPSVAVTSTTDVNCNGGTDGAIDITVTGGTAPYTYSWTNGATTEDLTGLGAGSYTGTITDANGCTAIGGPITINEPADTIAISAVVTDVTNAGGSDGAIDITVSGGTSPYTYSWSNGSTSGDLTGLTAGTYDITVTDANGCTETLSVEVMDGTNSLASLNANIGTLNLYPNPANQQVTLELELTQVSNVNVEVTNLNGQVLTAQSFNEVSETQVVLNIEDWARGVYLVKIQTETGADIVRFVKQ
jgi:hypothetical protein